MVKEISFDASYNKSSLGDNVLSRNMKLAQLSPYNSFILPPNKEYNNFTNHSTWKTFAFGIDFFFFSYICCNSRSDGIKCYGERIG